MKNNDESFNVDNRYAESQKTNEILRVKNELERAYMKIRTLEEKLPKELKTTNSQPKDENR